MNIRPLAVLLVGATLTVSVIVACDDGGGGGGDPVTLEQMPAEIAGVLCDVVGQCYGGLGVEEMILPNCEAEFTAELEDSMLPLWEQAIAAGDATYHDSAARGCLSAIRSAGCEILAGSFPSACNEALAGELAPGSACNSTIECAGDDFCRFNGSCPGVCAERVAAGAPCTEADLCVSGTTCQGGLCARLAGEGEPCGGEGDRDCSLPLVCLDETAGGDNTCRDPATVMIAAEGEPCEVEGGVLCREGLSCVVDSVMPLTFQCVAASSSGGPCRPGFPDPCPGGEFCDYDVMTGVDGSCAPLPGAGEACNEQELTPECAGGLECNGEGLCAGRQRLGASCAEADDCYSSLCLDGVCAAPTCEL